MPLFKKWCNKYLCHSDLNNVRRVPLTGPSPWQLSPVENILSKMSNLMNDVRVHYGDPQLFYDTTQADGDLLIEALKRIEAHRDCD